MKYFAFFFVIAFTGIANPQYHQVNEQTFLDRNTITLRNDHLQDEDVLQDVRSTCIPAVEPSNHLPAVRITDTSNVFRYWFTFGLYMEMDNTSTMGSYSFSTGHLFYKAGYYSRGGLLGGFDTDGLNIQSVDFGCGARVQTEWFQVAFFSGPSYIWGERKLTGNTLKTITTVGLQNDLQLLFRYANELGLGVGLYANLNTEKIYYGLNINLTIGNGK